MADSGKRKQPPAGGASGPNLKKRQGGSAGRWQTPHHKRKLETLKGRTIEVGDAGVWATCMRGKERQAAEELVGICNEYGEKLYGIKPPEPESEPEDGDDGGDIEASIQRELESMKKKPRREAADNDEDDKEAAAKQKKDPPAFEAIRVGIECLFFVRTRPPVDPTALVAAICEDARACDDRQKRRTRFVNRLTPVVAIEKANITGVEDVARRVLAPHFQLLAGDDEDDGAAFDEKKKDEVAACSYAIRPTLRAHSTLKRDDVIKKVASLIAPRHKVNLTAPDKVILIDIFQTLCGISVVNGNWDAMKRFNVYELYEAALKRPAAEVDRPAPAKTELSQKEVETGTKG